MYACQCVLWMCIHVHILIHLCNFISIYIYMYNGRYLCIPNIKYTIFSHVFASCMYIFIFRKKYIVYPFFGTLIDFPLLISRVS